MNIDEIIKDMNIDEIIKEKNLQYTQNIDDFYVGEIVVDKITGTESEILSKTFSSIQVSIKKNKENYVIEHCCTECNTNIFLEKNKKFICLNKINDKICNNKNSIKTTNYSGINCTQYLNMTDFNKIYRKI